MTVLRDQGLIDDEYLVTCKICSYEDLERKLRHFRDYQNHGRVHVSLKGKQVLSAGAAISRHDGQIGEGGGLIG